jgi:hypothetical protein
LKFIPAKYLLIVFTFFVSVHFLDAQDSIPDNTNTVDSVKLHSPKRAARLSAILPGAGQIYNHKYETKKWFTYAKVTAIWGGGAALLYFLQFNNKQYLRYKNAFIYRMDQDPLTVDEFNDDPRFTAEVIKQERDSWRRYRDYCGLGFLGLYFLNIVEASVTAHFWDYDISEDLSLSVRPQIISPMALNTNTIGLKLSLKLY